MVIMKVLIRSLVSRPRHRLQDEIARLMALPVEHIEVDEEEDEEDEEDDRPLWQRRLDAEADDGDGRSSNIP